MRLPPPLRTKLEQLLSASIDSVDRVGGGCINQAATISAGARRWFVKWNGSPLPAMFEREADGLEMLRAPDAIRVPEPVAWSDPVDDVPGFLLMEQIDTGGRSAVGPRFGEELARLHAATGEAYGHDRDNYVGSLEQENERSAYWVAFYGERRLRAQLELATDRNALPAAVARRVEQLIARLADLLPRTPPVARLHGDLWSGNYLVDDGGAPVLVDPAFYFGDREIDLAMAALFGGFPRGFFEAYDAAWRLDPGWEDRRAIYQAYPLLVHVNLFGGGYVSQLDGVLRRFV